jgi:hypothetical protein
VYHLAGYDEAVHAWWSLALVAAACRGRDAPERTAPRVDAAVKLDDRERELDEREAALERKLRELTSRPLADGSADPALVRGAPFEDVKLGTTVAPFGPLAPLRPAMTRKEVLAAIPTATAAGEILWVPTGIEGVTAELFFDPAERFERLVYRLPISGRHTVSLAWGPPNDSNTWFGTTADHWRAMISDVPKNGKLELSISTFTRFSDLIGAGPDGLADRQPLIGAQLAELRTRYGARLLDPELGGDPAELVLSGATDLCGRPTELMLPLDLRGRVKSILVFQCFDDHDDNRRSALAAMEKQWGPGTPMRTEDDVLVFAWTLATRSIEARVTRDHHGAWVWQVKIAPK